MTYPIFSYRCDYLSALGKRLLGGELCLLVLALDGVIGLELEALREHLVDHRYLQLRREQVPSLVDQLLGLLYLTPHLLMSNLRIAWAPLQARGQCRPFSLFFK